MTSFLTSFYFPIQFYFNLALWKMIKDDLYKIIDLERYTYIEQSVDMFFMRQNKVKEDCLYKSFIS